MGDDSESDRSYEPPQRRGVKSQKKGIAVKLQKKPTKRRHAGDDIDDSIAALSSRQTNTVALREHELISQLGGHPGRLYRDKFPSARKRVQELNATLFHSALFKNIDGDPPLSQALTARFSISNDVAPHVACAMADFAKSPELLQALKSACKTWPSLGSYLHPLTRRILRVVNATLGTLTHHETNSALIRLARWVLSLYEKTSKSFFAKLCIAKESALVFCARFYLIVFEDLAFDDSFFSTVLSGELAEPMQLSVRAAVEAKYDLKHASASEGRYVSEPELPIQFYAGDSDTINEANINALTRMTAASTLTVDPPFTPREELAFCRAFRGEIKSGALVARFCIREISAVLPLRCDQDVIDYYNAHLTTYGLALKQSRTGIPRIEYAPLPESTAASSQRSSKRLKITAARSPTLTQHGDHFQQGRPDEAPTEGTSNPMIDIDNAPVELEAKVLDRPAYSVSAVSSKDLRSIAFVLNSREGDVRMSDDGADQISQLNKSLAEKRSALNELIDERAGQAGLPCTTARAADALSTEIWQAQQEIKLQEYKLQLAKKSYYNELARQCYDQGLLPRLTDGKVNRLHADIAELKEQYSMEIDMLRHLQESRIERINEHHEHEYMRQKITYETKLRQVARGAAARVQPGLSHGITADRVAASAGEAHQLQSKLTQIEIEFATARRKLRDKVEESRSLRSQLTHVENELNAAKVELSEKTQDASSARARLNEEVGCCNRLRASLESIQNVVQTQNDYRERIEERDASVRNLNKGVAKASAENRSLQKEISRLQASNATLLVDHDALRDQMSKQKNENYWINKASMLEQQNQNLEKKLRGAITPDLLEQMKQKYRNEYKSLDERKVASTGRRDQYIRELKADMIRLSPGLLIPDPKDGHGPLPRL